MTKMCSASTGQVWAGSRTSLSSWLDRGPPSGAQCPGLGASCRLSPGAEGSGRCSAAPCQGAGTPCVFVLQATGQGWECWLALSRSRHPFPVEGGAGARRERLEWGRRPLNPGNSCHRVPWKRLTPAGASGLIPCDILGSSLPSACGRDQGQGPS